MQDKLPPSLLRARYLNLATLRRDGTHVETPVWFAEHAGHLYVFSEAGAGKMKRLRNFSRIRIAACGAMGALKGSWLDSTGRHTTDSATVEAAYAALHEKYGFQMALGDFFSRLSGRRNGRAIIEIDLDTEDT
jgi:PPOX class probable F420-dependent enzyme